ncbi:MAG TPA: MFS transporter [Rectinemataceae bacterium]|nr:MFS transporter [Rectinemataceae bacterium]
MTAKERRKAAYAFLVLLGIISLFSDLTYEGARSILGPFLLLLGASAATVGFVSGLGELIGYALRLATGFISDRSRRYWLMTIIGYAINLLAVPALALAPGYGWMFACGLIVLERFGKAIRHPAKTTLVSFAANEVGAGTGFALQQVLDQIGAFLGPVLLFAVLSLKETSGDKLSAYSLGFLLLGIPGLTVMALLVLAKIRYPRPHELESAASTPSSGGPSFDRVYWFYMAGIALLGFGFADFPLMAFHLTKRQILADNLVPICYAVAMAVDAASSFVFGRMYDRRGMDAIVLASAVSAFFAPLVFLFRAPVFAILGIVLWGVGMGAQESVLKAVVAKIVVKERRGVAYGIFYTGFGAFWFLGSWAMGLLYDRSLPALVIMSLTAQLAALPFFIRTKSLLARSAKG